MQKNKEYYLEKIEKIFMEVMQLDRIEIKLIRRTLKRNSLDEIVTYYYKLIERI